MRLFEPTDIDIFREHPELKEYKEFAGLSNEEMRYVWEHSNPMSDNSKIANSEARRRACYEKVWGNTSDSRYVQYVSGNVPEQVRSACERMRSFNPSRRMRAKIMVEKMFADFEKIMEEEMPLDATKIKAFAEVKLKIASELPDLIKRLEGGFGFKEDTVKDPDKRTPSYMDELHDELARN